jgi:glutathione S-transferase
VQRPIQGAHAHTDDGAYLFDSRCEYLDSIGSAPKLFPAPGPARWKALTQEALADGILDATQPRRRELTLPQDEGRKSYIALQQGKVARAVVEFEKQASSLGNLDTIGEITIGCALGYLEFRYANEPCRPGHPELTAWYEKAVNLAPLAETMPVG